jgi:glycosyltransferase involved in cell wall biosynthesis
MEALHVQAENGVSPTSPSVTVIMPVFNDWPSAFTLIVRLNALLVQAGYRPTYLMINDGSTELPASTEQLASIPNVSVLHLRRNLGHQRAICIGISWLAENLEGNQPIVLMDSDGEDRPEEVKRLLNQYDLEDGQKIVFAERTRRSEGFLFTFFYNLYCFLHIFLVGHRVRFGNFSVIPSRRLSSLTVVPELWNHYAAAVMASKQPFATVSTVRGDRYFGDSKMNFTELVIHGLSALSVFSDRLSVRISFFLFWLLLLIASAAGLVIGAMLFAGSAIPRWMSYSGGLLFLCAMQLITLLSVFCFMILANRKGNTFLPIRDYRYFIDHIETLSR